MISHDQESRATNVSTAELSLCFSEDVQSFDVTSVVLHADAVIQEQTCAHVRLTEKSDAEINGADPARIVVSIHTVDMNAIKRLNTLANGTDSAHLTTLASTFADHNGYSVSPAAWQQVAADGFTPDTVLPTIREFTLDLDKYLLHITISETISWRSFDQTQVTLQESQKRDKTTTSM
jgi:hypothetical protein